MVKVFRKSSEKVINLLNSVTRLENQPIIIATFSEVVTTKDMVEMFHRTDELIAEGENNIYRITDVRDATSNFVEMLGAIKEASTGQPGSTTDPRIHATLVGTTTWINFARNALKSPNFGGVQLAAFDSMDDALESIQIQLDAAAPAL